MEILVIILTALCLILTVIVLITLNRLSDSTGELLRSDDDQSDREERMLRDLKGDMDRRDKNGQEQTVRLFKLMMGQIGDNQKAASDMAAAASDAQLRRIAADRENMDKRLEVMQKTLNDRLDTQTRAINDNFTALRRENTQQIDKIRESVSEKLDKTLNSQFDRSFKGIIEQMENLSNSMGELKGISTQVGSLERTLNGVKTRGIIGENQLKMIIADILNPSQYEEEVPTFPGSSERVEIAIRLPDRNSDGFRYLPIDSKCHIDRYEEVVAALESGDKDSIARARRNFRTAIREDARDISSKYVKAPYTTPYAILFVPFEGMYSEIVGLDMLDELNRLQVSVVGPYTISAVLSTVVNYWQALAIEKKSNDIEKTLMEAKTAFGKFDEQLAKVRKNLYTASTNLENLQTTRTKAILKALRNVPELAANEYTPLIDNVSAFDEDDLPDDGIVLE